MPNNAIAGAGKAPSLRRSPGAARSGLALAVRSGALAAALHAAAAGAASTRPHAASAAPPVREAPPSQCVEDDGSDPRSAPVSRSVSALGPSPVASGSGGTPTAAHAANAAAANAAAPRLNLLMMVQAAIRRSNAVGAAKLLSDAAQADIGEARASGLPQVTLTGQLGGIDTGAVHSTPSRGWQFQGNVSAGAPLYDGGRVHDLTDWRTHLAEAARLGEISAQEQVALQTVSLALERSRYTVESQVYEQYAHKMGCLVGALRIIVGIDKGRTSELVQAVKTQEQAELMRDQSLSQKHLAEVRLRRFVGDELPPTEGITSVLLDIPALPDLLSVASRVAEIRQLGAQADALDSYARAVLDGQKPQLGWLLSETRSLGAGNSRATSGGLTFSIPLFNAAASYSSDAARRRAEAARMQREDALEARKSRMAEVHEQAEHSMDRARHVVEILHNSDQVRNFTLQQWQQLGRRSLFDVMSAEGDHYNTRVQYVDALYDTQQSNALLWSLGLGLSVTLQ